MIAAIFGTVLAWVLGFVFIGLPAVCCTAGGSYGL